MDYDKNADGNLHALNKYMEQQDKEQIAYDAMMDELQELMEETLSDLYYKHEKIANKYNFDQKFIDTVKEFI